MSDSPHGPGVGDGERLRQVYELVLGARPDGITSDEVFAQLRDALGAIRGFMEGLATGDLSQELGMRGPIAGSLKSLRSTLKHVTWQAKEIAGGDLTQRIDYLGEFSVAFNEMADQLAAAHAAIVGLAMHDPLTGLLNRRSLSEHWTVETARADRSGEPIAVLLADLDKFKSVNDTWGHEGGDMVLVSFAETLTRTLRGSDIACRLGGDEFAVVLPGTTVEEAVVIANRIREAYGCAERPALLEGCVPTTSIGVATYPARGRTLDEVLHAADEALYEVKARGRDCCVAATAEDDGDAESA